MATKKKTTKKAEKPQKKKKGIFSKIIVITIVLQVIVYTWVHLFLSQSVGVEIAPMTSVAFYGFCGAEAGLLAWIKNTKTKGE